MADGARGYICGLVGFSVLTCAAAMQGQKTRFGQELPYAKAGVIYPIKMHISGVHYRAEYEGGGNSEDVLYAEAVINGKKVELRGLQSATLQNENLLGDAQVRFLKDPSKTGPRLLFQKFEEVFPDKRVWQFSITGVSE